jgi:two-component system, sensor histidine kinase
LVVGYTPPRSGHAESLAREGPNDAGATGAGHELRFPIRGLSFQNRIAVVALVTAVAVLMGACALFMLQQWRTERAHFIQAQQSLAAVTAEQVTGLLRLGPAHDVDGAVLALRTDPQVLAASLTDGHGRRIAGFAQRSARLGRPAGRDLITVRAPVGAGGELALTIEPEGPAGLIPRFISMGGALFFMAAGLALYMGRWLAARLTRPVDRLSRAMHEVAGSRDFTRRVVHGEDDEFGRLTQSFNSLLVQLETNDRALRKTMDELVEARDAAEAANVLKSHFLANMSHEIRTPLNGVLAMAQIMAIGELDPKQRERLAVIRQSGESLLTVLNDILDLSKIEAGRMELDEVEFDTADVAAKLTSAHAAVAARKGLSFSVDVTPDAEGLRRGDVMRLQQIISNLVANAVKFTPTGEVRILIDGEGPTGADGLKVSVTDTGIGVPSDKLPLLFQKFSQVDSSTTRQFGGTGLGLAICRELAQLMGGQVWAESLQGVGSTFFLSLPLARVQAATGPGTPSEERAPETGGDVSSLKVLAAEDNPTNQLVLKTVLATFGLEADIVPDGQKAIEAWAAGDYDLILMDIQMPGTDGISATREIRAAEARTGRRRTPIIALSANAMTHQVREYLEAGMDLHVAKPIQLGRLHEALERVLYGESEASEPAPPRAEAGRS